MKLAFIPRGTFRMGRPTAPNAQPIHNVTLIAFWIGQYEVTNREFALYKKRKLPAESLTPQQPAVSISWHDADQFCKWLSKRESRSYRLPTEAEWEYAARGGLDQKEYPWGDQRPEGRATFMSMTTTPVGKYAPNGYGLYDVAGNAGEWVSDWYGESYYSRSPAINPKGSSKSEWDTKPAPKGQWKILRGGSHMLFEGQAGVREPWPLDISPAPSGFRVVMEKKKTH